ncbi:hypothetical protein LCGC14_1491760, partial [marine sediment metagenome]
MSKELIRAVVEARSETSRLKAHRDESLREWEDAHSGLMEDLKEAGETLTKAEEALREAALEEYEVTKNKKPFPGVKIQAPEKPMYEAGKAFEWAVEHKQAIIPASLNVGEFEAIVDAMKVKPDFVT